MQSFHCPRFDLDCLRFATRSPPRLPNYPKWTTRYPLWFNRSHVKESGIRIPDALKPIIKEKLREKRKVQKNGDDDDESDDDDDNDDDEQSESLASLPPSSA